jgi:hypothetical protein
MVPTLENTRMHPVRPVHPVQTAESFLLSVAVGQGWLEDSSTPGVPMSSVKPAACPLFFPKFGLLYSRIVGRSQPLPHPRIHRVDKAPLRAPCHQGSVRVPDDAVGEL